MKIEEVFNEYITQLTQLRDYIQWDLDSGPKDIPLALTTTDEEVIIDALSKQIPRKPLNETGYYRDNKCPSCFKPIKSGKGSSSHYRNNWCNNCGQRIDWSE